MLSHREEKEKLKIKKKNLIMIKYHAILKCKDKKKGCEGGRKKKSLIMSQVENN